MESIIGGGGSTPRRWVRFLTVLVVSLVGALAVVSSAAGAVPPCAASSPAVSGPVVACSFGGPGAFGAKTWTVPAGVTSVTFDLYGAAAQGYDAYWYVGVGGYGGETKATMRVVPGTHFEFVIGGSTGFNGGGAGGPSGFPGAGATDVRIGACAVTASCGLSARILVAGGGGAAPNDFGGGGSGGGLIGQDGGGVNGGGTGGTQTAGGIGNLGGGNGRLGVGGRGDGDGGGGGGGYYGGGGGGYGDGGGGGSGYVSGNRALGITNSSMYTGVRSAGGYDDFPNYPNLDGLAIIRYTVHPG